MTRPERRLRTLVFAVGFWLLAAACAGLGVRDVAAGDWGGVVLMGVLVVLCVIDGQIAAERWRRGE